MLVFTGPGRRNLSDAKGPMLGLMLGGDRRGHDDDGDAFMRRLGVLLAGTVTAIVTAGGCQGPPSDGIPSTPPPALRPLGTGGVSRQLMVKFKSHTIACEPGAIADFSSATQVPLEYVRPMSGDACVITQFADTAEHLSQGLGQLKQHAAVEWAEEDRTMKGFSSRRPAGEGPEQESSSR